MNTLQRLKLCWRILNYKDGNLLSHADNELLSAPEDEMQQEMNDCIKEIILVFGTQGHSGFSASYAISCLEKLLRFKPLRPLTGEDDEWVCHDYGNGDVTYQNKRCSHVFKGVDGQAYDSNGKVFVDEDGCSYTSGDSRVNIVFPYTPTTEYVNVKNGD